MAGTERLQLLGQHVCRNLWHHHPCGLPTTVTSGVKPNGNAFSIARLNSGKCGGSTDFISALIDWKPLKRMDVYAGVMVSNVYGGLANGYFATQTVNPTAGIRIKF